MKIDGIDIRKFGARQHRVDIGHMTTKFSNEWEVGDVLPFMGLNSPGFKQVTITLVMKGKTRGAIINARSELLGLLTKPVVIDLNKNTHHFLGALKTHKETEVSKERWHNLELTFECYEYGDDVSAEGASSFSVVNPGTTTSPCIVEITPGIGSSEITLTGICRNPVTGEDEPVHIPDVTTEKVILLDGISGLITEDGSLKEVDMWDLPSLKPGTNIIECDDRLMDIKVTVRPIYM